MTKSKLSKEWGKTNSCFLFHHHYSSSSVACLFILSIDKNDSIQFDRLEWIQSRFKFRWD